ncbi:MAG: DUF1844 domain-containing protein [Deltaproteobacteria bacterium]|nr:DUF1844 domain-containing protein [Deltaproteobacteria bacterium]
MSEEEEKGFVIKDRRRFTGEGEPVEQAEPEAKAEPEVKAEPKAKAEPEAREEPPRSTQQTQVGPLPEINFSTFIFSLSTSVLLHLGEMPDPNTKQVNKNLDLAKQTIDILGMLQEKTRGNLEEDESNLLENLLSELRMKYVAATK